MTSQPASRPTSSAPAIDRGYVERILMELLAIHSPTGYTDAIVHRTCEELEHLGIPFELTRRGAIRADLPGRRAAPARAIVSHLDTLGAMVTALNANGRLSVAPIGVWSSRFAEGARVTIYSNEGYRTGTILPLLASGHAYGDAVDTQPVRWDQLEVRVDEVVETAEDLHRLGLRVGDYVAVDAEPDRTPSGFIRARHLDDKAGVAVVLGAARAILETGVTPATVCHLIFTISEEVGSGSSHTLHGDVAEMVTVDTAARAANQQATEFGVTLAHMDSTGPFDYHLTRKLGMLCETGGIQYRDDVFRYYRCDSASAVEAGNDLRTALACFGVDATHGWERTHVDSLEALARLLVLYIQSPPTFARDADELGPLEGFPEQPTEPGAPQD